MTARLALVALALCAGCDNLPEITLGSCGNHVVEPSLGEDCDNAGPGCGAPFASAAACRFVCDPTHGVACPSGSSCGLDHICRAPTGTYTLGPAIGGTEQSAGNLYAVEDVDADGAPDLLVRNSAELSIYRNDGTGQFALSSVGRMPSIDTGSATTPMLAVADAGATSLIAAVGADGVGLYRRNGAGIDPIVVPATLLPAIGPTLSARSLVAVALLPPQQTPVALLFEPVVDGGASRQLSAYSLTQDPLRALAPIASIAVPTSCIADGSWTARTTSDATPATSVVLAFHDACVVRFDAGGKLVVSMLTRSPSVPLQNRPSLADVDGDGLLDVVVATDVGGPARAVWLAQSGGTFAAPVIVPATDAGGSGAVGVADFDGDGREDLVSAGEIFLNRTTGAGASFAAAAGFVGKMPSPGAAGGVSSVAGDLNGDGHADYIVWGGGFVSCFGRGDGVHFSCAPLPAAFAPDDAVLIGDVNGDGIGDVVAVPAAPGASILVQLGRYLSPLEPVTTRPIAPNGQTLVGAALTPVVGRDVPSLVVEVGGAGLATGVADADGVLSFMYPVTATDAVFAARDGAELDLLVERADGGHVLRLSTTLTAAATDVALGVPAAGAHLWRLGDAGPSFVVDATAATPWYAPLGAGAMTIEMLPPLRPPTAELRVDLDGDGVAEILESEPTSACGVRVLHATADGALEAIDSPVRCFLSTIVLDLPPFDGRLDLVTRSDLGSIVGARAEMQKSDFTFAGVSNDLRINDGSSGGADPQFFSEIASVDLDGDGFVDVCVVGADGLVHAVFADVVRR